MLEESPDLPKSLEEKLKVVEGMRGNFMLGGVLGTFVRGDFRAPHKSGGKAEGCGGNER